jgi:spore maturation protein CgeB
MKIAFFGSSLLSAYWNGAATYYRGIIRALHRHGHRVTFHEPDAYERQSHRDIDPPPWATVVVYENSEDAVFRQLEAARDADLIVKASGVGVFDELLEAAVLSIRSASNRVVFWDVDAPATLDRVHANKDDPFRALIARYDYIFTYGGGAPVVDAYRRLGARRCLPIYNALDPDIHAPAPPDRRFEADLAFLGNRLPDREARVEEFFLTPARELPDRRFLLAGNGWQDKCLPANVRCAGHLYTRDHNAFNCSPLAILNVARESMAAYGFSPATRVFEAAGAGACVISDAWEGIESFFEPGKEILVAPDGLAVAELLRRLIPARARDIGRAARRRALAEHTYAHRVEEFERALDASPRRSLPSASRTRTEAESREAAAEAI